MSSPNFLLIWLVGWLDMAGWLAPLYLSNLSTSSSLKPKRGRVK